MPLKRKTLQHQRKSSNYKTHSSIYSHQTVSEEKIKRKTNNPLSALKQPKSHPKTTTKPDLERKSKGKIKKKTKKTLRWMGSSAAAVVRLGLLVAVRWLGCRILRSRTRDRERTVTFGRRWRTHSDVSVAGSWVVDGGGLVVDFVVG
jgi:hypothetical protein